MDVVREFAPYALISAGIVAAAYGLGKVLGG